MDETWRTWVEQCLSKGGDPKELALILRRAKFEIPDIQNVMGDAFPTIVLGDANTPNEASFFDQKSAVERLRKTPSGTTLKIDADAPAGMLLVHEYISRSACDRLVEYVNARMTADMGIQDTGEVNLQRIWTGTPDRVAHEMHTTDASPELLTLCSGIWRNVIAPFYNVECEWYERPQLLCYPPGGKYDAHSDSEIWCKETKQWKKIFVQRDYSFLLYLNDEYEGGEIDFPRQQYRIKPEPGMLLAFPSDNRYMHAVVPTRTGLRYVVTTWASTTRAPDNLPPNIQGKVVILKNSPGAQEQLRA